MRLLAIASIASASLLASGCYNYRDVNTGTSIPAETFVRVELTDAGTTNVTKAIGPYVMWLEGPVETAGSDGVTLRVTTLRRRGEGDTRWIGEQLKLGREDIRYMRSRQLSRGRTIAAATGFIGGGLGLLYIIAKAAGLVSGTPMRPPTPPGT